MTQRTAHDDLPKTRIADDRLGRKAFCENLADVLLLPQGHPCRVISLEGQWGEGKTSAIEMTIDVLGRAHADKRPIVVRFNPWQVGGSDSLQAALISRLAIYCKDAQSNLKAGERAKAFERLLDYSNALALIRSDGTSLAFGLIARISIYASRRIADMRVGNISRLKERVSDELKNLDRPILIVLDDLDRLLPPEAAEVIRLVRAVADFESTTYLLAYDHDRFVEILGGAGLPNPAQYMEKIVHLRAHLPPIKRRNLRDLFTEKIELLPAYLERRCFPGSEQRRRDVFDLVVSRMLDDARSISRVVSRVEMVRKDVFQEVEFWDVVGLAAISVACPASYEYIRANAAWMTGKEEYWASVQGRDVASEQRKTGLAKTYEGISVRKKDLIRNLLIKLFPRTETKYGMYSDASLRHNGNVGVFENLVISLSSSLDGDDVSMTIVREIISNPRNRHDLIDMYGSSWDSLIDLIEVISGEIQANDLDVAEVASFCEIIMGALTRVCKEEGFSRFGSGAFLSTVPEILVILFKAENVAESLLRASSADQFGVFYCALVEQLLDSETNPIAEMKSFGGEDVEKLRARALEFGIKARGAASSGGIDVASSLLFSLRRILKDGFRKVLHEISKESGGKSFLIETLSRGIVSSSAGVVATWGNDMREAVDGLNLESEAIAALADQNASPGLRYGAKALLEGASFVIDTGERYRT